MQSVDYLLALATTATPGGLREALMMPPGVRPDGPQSELHVTYGAFEQYLDTGDECFTANMQPDGMRSLLRYFADRLATTAAPSLDVGRTKEGE